MYTYCESADVLTYATIHGYSWSTVSTNEQKQIIEQATRHIEAYHSQPRTDPETPWLYGDEFLRQAAMMQACFLIKGLYVIESRDLAAAYTGGQMADQVISATPDGQSLIATAAAIVDYVMSKNNMSGYRFERG